MKKNLLRILAVFLVFTFQFSSLTMFARADADPPLYFFARNGNGSDSGDDYGETYYGGTIVEVEGNPYLKTGKVFGGWNSAADGSGTFYGEGTTLKLLSNVTTYAQWMDTATTAEGFVYAYDASHAVITGYTGSSGAVSIPETIESRSVVLIGANAFAGNSTITSLSIPASVESISMSAFDGCSLTSVTFSGTSQLNGIGNYAFYSAAGLTSITIPANVISIGSNAFNECLSLSNVSFASGSSLQTIEDRAFYGCSQLTSIMIPASVNFLDESVFQYCASLSSVNFESGSVLDYIYGSTFSHCSQLTSITLPEYLNHLGESAFEGSTQLEDAYFLGDAPQIGSNAFASVASGFKIHYISGKTGWTTPTWNGYAAEPLVSQLTGFAAISNVSAGTAGSATYANAAAVSTYLIANKGTVTANYATGTVSVPVTSWTDTDSYSPAVAGSYTFTAVLGTLPAGYANSGSYTATVEVVIVPAAIAVTYDGNGSDGGAAVTGGSYTVGTYIDAKANTYTKTGKTFGGWNTAADGSGTFYGVGTYVKMTSNVTLYAQWMDTATTAEGFAYAYDATHAVITGYTGSGGAVSIPETIDSRSVVSIGASAFLNKTTVTSVSIPASVVSLSTSAFQGCTAIASVNISGSSQLKGIGTNAFYGDTALTSITIPASVIGIGVGAFQNCTTLSSVNFGSGSGLGIIGSSAFHTSTLLTSISLPASVTNIGPSAFVASGLTSIAIPDFVTDIQNDTFRYCLNLTSVSFGSGSTLKTIGAAAFLATGLRSVSIPDSVTLIQQDAFRSCANLENVSFGNQLTGIGRWAFLYSALKSVTFPASLNYLGTSAFEGATQLKDAYFLGNAPTLQSNNVFALVASGFKIHYLSDKTGWTTPTWNGYAAEPAGTFTQLTGFAAISNVSAGTEGSATYANAAAVSTYLMSNKGTVTANYASGTVSVPVASWTDTDSYNPAVAGSYTFTAVLGTLPNGYINSGNYTATVEVVVSAAAQQLTGFAAIANVSAGTAGAATYANAAAVSSYLIANKGTVTANYATGTVSVPVTSWTDTDSYNPAVAGSYTFTAVLGTLPAGYANSGSYTATVEVVVSAPAELTGFAAISNVSAGTAGSATYANAAAVSTYLMANNGTVTANYASGTVSVPVASWTDTDSYNPAVAGSYTFTAVLGTLPAGYANSGSYTATVEVVVSAAAQQLTGFAAVSNVSAGTAGSATYANAAAVSTYLMANKGTVTANYASGIVSVPVASWTNTDSYNPAVAGSYTFTAVLGTLPAGYANSGSYTATVEVVIVPAAIAVTYDGNGSDGGAAVTGGSYTVGTYIDAKANTYTKTGKTFGGWNTAADGSGTFYGVGTYVKMTSNVTLYAQWMDTATTAEGFAYAYDATHAVITGYTGSGGAVSIPETIDSRSVVSIGASAFLNKTTITSVSIPASVVSLSTSAFQGCTAIASVTFSGTSQLKSIGFSAFYNTTANTVLTSITIPASVTSIGQNGIRGYTNLTTVNFAAGSALEYLGLSVFDGDSNLANMTLPSSTTNISSYAFRGCKFTSFVVPYGCTTINQSTFENCTSLTSVTIPSTVTSIGAFAFYSNSALTSVTIPDNVTSIGQRAFQVCSSLVSVNFGSGSLLASISDHVFAGCTALGPITLPASVTSIGTFSFEGTNSCTSFSFAVGSGITSLPEGLFYNSTGLQSITLPSSLTTIGPSVFRGCTNLSSITIPDNVTAIGLSAFQSCTLLASVNFGSGSKVTSIENDAFNASGLTSFTLPATVTTLGYRVFKGCTALTSFNFASGSTLTAIQNDFLMNCTALTSITIPQSVTAVNTQAFNGSSALTDIYFMGNAPTLGTAVFTGTASGFKIRYLSGKTGWTTPTWNGYAAEPEGTVYQLTGFAAISNVSAGTAGSATYANAAAVSTYLMSNKGTVTANYASGTVSVPVASWTDTDSYNPAVAGSYTFTAVLGTLPGGYANSGNYTATVEVVVSAAALQQLTAFAAIANVSAGTAGSATYANAAAVSTYLIANSGTVTANYASGTVSVPVTSWTDTDSYNPAVAGSYTFTAVLGTLPAGYANSGSYTATVEVVVSAAAASQLTGFAAISNVSAGTEGSATYANAAAVSTYLIANKGTVTANYASGTVSVPVTSWTDTDSYNPAVAGSYTFTAVLGTLPAGYANSGSYTATVEVVVSAAAQQLIGFAAIANVSAGTAGAATYANAAAVSSYLMTNNASVTATYEGGTVSVPVISWTDSDSYNPAVAGSYTFTAVLGTLPAGYANSGSYTATAEVVVSAAGGAPTLTVSDATKFWTTTFTKSGTTYNIIRYSSSGGKTVGDLLGSLSISNGSIKVFDKNSNEITSNTSSVVSTNCTVRLYDSSNTVVSTYGVVYKGDIDGNGTIIGTDNTQIKRIIAGTSTQGIYSFAAADINGNGVTGADATLLKRTVAGTYTINQLSA